MTKEHPITPADLSAKIAKICREAIQEQPPGTLLEHQMLGIVLLDLSLKMTREGGLQFYYRHLHYMKNKGEDRLKDLHKEFGDKFDFDKLQKDFVLKLHDTVQ